MPWAIALRGAIIIRLYDSNVQVNYSANNISRYLRDSERSSWRGSFFPFSFFFFQKALALNQGKKGFLPIFPRLSSRKKKKSDCSNRKSGKRDSRDFVIHRLSSPLPWLPSGSIVFLYSETRIQGAVDGYADFYLSERYEFLVLLSNVKFSFTFIVAALRGYHKKK